MSGPRAPLLVHLRHNRLVVRKTQLIARMMLVSALFYVDYMPWTRSEVKVPVCGVVALRFIQRRSWAEGPEIYATSLAMWFAATLKLRLIATILDAIASLRVKVSLDAVCISETVLASANIFVGGVMRGEEFSVSKRRVIAETQLRAFMQASPSGFNSSKSLGGHF